MQILLCVCIPKKKRKKGKKENKREGRAGNGEFEVAEGSFHCFCFVKLSVQFAFCNLISKSHLCMRVYLMTTRLIQTVT